jgi:WXG100 family type VII secretion target
MEMLMPKAHVDPTELRRFARDLARFNHDLQALMMGLHSRMRELEKTWRDQEQRKFADEFEQTMKAMARFTEATEQHIGFLQQRAGHIEEYLQQR